MGDAKWKTINKSKLEAEIDGLAARIDGLTGGRGRTRDLSLAIRHAELVATHNALVAVFNSLD